MYYTQAKQTFEVVIKKMQDDLQAYAATEKANQRAVDIRMDMLNKLVAFYQAAEEQISELEMQQTGMQVQYSDLHDTTQKLVYWCRLHGVNVMQPLFYSTEELEQMILRGRKFRIVYTENLIDQFDTVEKILSREYEDFLQDDRRYSQTQFQCHLQNVQKSGL